MAYTVSGQTFTDDSELISIPCRFDDPECDPCCFDSDCPDCFLVFHDPCDDDPNCPSFVKFEDANEQTLLMACEDPVCDDGKCWWCVDRSAIYEINSVPYVTLAIPNWLVFGLNIIAGFFDMFIQENALDRCKDCGTMMLFGLQGVQGSVEEIMSGKIESGFRDLSYSIK